MAKKIDPKIKIILQKMVDAEIIGLLKQKNLSILFEVSQSVISELLLEIKSEHINNKIKNNLNKAKESNNEDLHFVWNKLIEVINQNAEDHNKLSIDTNVETLYNQFLLQSTNHDRIMYRSIFDIVVKYLDIYKKDYNQSCEGLINYVYHILALDYPDKFIHNTKIEDKAHTLLREIHTAYTGQQTNRDTDILCKIILNSDSIEIPDDNKLAVDFFQLYPQKYADLHIDLPNMVTFIMYNTLLNFVF